MSGLRREALALLRRASARAAALELAGAARPPAPAAAARPPAAAAGAWARGLAGAAAAAQHTAAAAAAAAAPAPGAPAPAPLGGDADFARAVDSVETSGPGGAKEHQVSMKAALIFDAAWRRAEARHEGRMVCPREVVWLNGAPGSGKGTNMPFIMRSRGLSRALGVSQLLDGAPEIRALVDRGELVPDPMVLDALLDAVLAPEGNDGAGLVLDGFPRTATQVDFVKLLHDRLLAAHAAHADGPEEWRFPRPSFKVVILYVDEEESVLRQLKRARLAALHNRRALDAGSGDRWAVRATDVSEALCRRRYQVFRAHYSTILRLKSYFSFSLIDAMGSLDECRAQIMRELRYQSSLDLDAKTYAAIRHLPLARDLVRVARQRLVFRLDRYCRRHPRVFAEAVELIGHEALPVLKQCSLAGHAEWRSRHPLLLANPLAIDMIIDVLTDRGFSAAHAREERLVPRRVDLATGAVQCGTEVVHSFRITFEREGVRDLSVSPAGAAAAGHPDDVAIGSTYVPSHLRRGSDAVGTVPAPPPPPRAPAPAATAGAAAAGAAAGAAAANGARARGRSAAEEQEMRLVRGWESADAELSEAARARALAYEELEMEADMNERED